MQKPAVTYHPGIRVENGEHK